MSMIEHNATGPGDTCERCGQPKARHRSKRVRVRSWSRKVIGEARADKRKAYDIPRKNREGDRVIVGIDGEGQDDKDGNHIYTYLAAVNENGVTVSESYNADGLTHEQCMDMLLAIPKNSLKFAFSFGYDITMMIRNMPDEVKYRLLRPGTRSKRNCKECKKGWNALLASKCLHCGSEKTTSSRPYLRWNNRGYDWFNNGLTVASGFDKAKQKWHRSCHVWDSFRFFGTSFVEALKDWDIGSPEQRERILEMKGKRGSFSEEKPEEVQAYCKEECHLLALMMRKVIKAHDDAGLHLERYDGAGSTASVMMKKHDVASYRGPKMRELPLELQRAIMGGFFGGRFENSSIGTIKGEVHGFDISSAYPYAQTTLPCLACGRWERANPRRLMKAVEGATLAICKFKVGAAPDNSRVAWMPLPFRDKTGSICYPTNFEGWAWKPEMLSALAGWPGLIMMIDAFVYHTDCDHKPFAHVPGYYRWRIELGKEGAGKAVKLGLNAGYGKNAQSVGDDPPYQQWAWAGMTTATTRAQMNIAISSAKDPWSVLSIATDGLYSTEKLAMALPNPTGTDEITVLHGDEKGKVKKKPLGGWEHKAIPEGAFFAKPGLYFKLSPELSDIRARGVGRKEVFEHRTGLIEAFNGWDRKDFDYSVALVGRRFYGAKHCIFMYSSCSKCGVMWQGVPEQKCPNCGAIGDEERTSLLRTPEPERALAYGRWCPRTSNIRFDPRPKRDAVFGGDKDYGRLLVRDMGGQTSTIYNPGETTPEGDMSKDSKEFMLEQPDWDEEV